MVLEMAIADPQGCLLLIAFFYSHLMIRHWLDRAG